MAQSSGEPQFTLRLIVDEVKNKVVLVEACMDFVDVLFSLLTLPMGTIARLLEKHQKSETVTVGCVSNLYRSAVNMKVDDFKTEACKQILLNPRSMKEVECKRLKLNINPTDDLKFFTCPSFLSCNMCSNFSTSLCRCGSVMNKELKLESKVDDNTQRDANGVFTSGRSAFIITDDLKVAVRTTDLVLKNLKSLGFGDVSKLAERLVDVGFDEILTLLGCIFSSNAPFTDTFLNKQTPQSAPKFNDSPSPYMKNNEDEAEPEKVLTLTAIVRRHDMKILYVECGEDFVDLLFTFLAVPVEYILGISGNSSTFGCIGNLFESSMDLSATEISRSRPVLPHCYIRHNQLLNIITDRPPLYYLYYNSRYFFYGLTTNSALSLSCANNKVVLIDPKSHGRDQSTEDSGFVKRDTKFTVTDDLIIKPIVSSSIFCLLKKLQIQEEDLELQEISIGKTEAKRLLRASLTTTSALNTALWNLIMKKPNEETLETSGKSKLKKPKIET